MKNSRKIISIILTICMIMQILPVFAAETATDTTPVGLVYLINDDFGENNTGDWEAKSFSGRPASTNDAKAEPVEEGSANYMLTYTTTGKANSQNGYLTKALPKPVTFGTNKDVVIEAKIKQAGTGRSFLKYNLDGRTFSYQEREFGWGMLVANANGSVVVSNGWDKNATTEQYNYYKGIWGGPENILSGATNDWYTYKVVIHGGTSADDHTATGNKADYYVTKPNGEVVSKLNQDIDFPDNSVVWQDAAAGTATGVNWVEDALNSVDFRLRVDGDDVTEKISIDYIRVYELYDAKLSTPVTVSPSGDIAVTIDAAEGNEAFKNAIALYDEKGVKVETTNTIDGTNKIVTLSPEKLLKEGGKYKAVLNTSAIPENYKFDVTEKEILVSDITYIVCDEFGKDNLSNWEHKKDAGQSTAETTTVNPVEIEGEPGNYALKYISSATPAANWRWNYISRPLSNPVTFEEGKDVVIETRFKTAGTGRAFLKMNLVTTPSLDTGSEWDHDSGTLIGSETSWFFAPNGWGASGYANKDKTLTNGFPNTWYTAKVIIHGNTKKASYEFKTGNNEPVKFEELDIDYPDSKNWTEDVLNTIDFRLRAAETLEIDYVKVYEAVQKDVQLTLKNGRYNKNDEDIILNVSTQAEDLVLLPGSFVLKDANGVVVSAEGVYDRTAGTFAITPKAPLTIGSVYTLTFADNEFAKFNGTKTFTIEARGEYENGNVIFDTFDNGTDGWVEGESNITTTVEKDTTTFPGKSVLKITSANSAVNGNGNQAVAYRKLGNGFKVNAGKKIVIKTSVYQTANAGRFYLKYNRPNSATQIYGEFTNTNYSILRYSDNYSYIPNTADDYNIIPFKAGEEQFLQPCGQWIDYTFEIDGAGKRIKATAIDENKVTYTAEGAFNLLPVAYEAEYGVGGAPAYVQAINSLTFQNGPKDEIIYVDYIQVYEEEDLSFAVEGSYKENEPIKVTFDAQYGNAALADAVELYGADGIIETENSIDESGKVVTLTHNGLTDGETYTVKLDKTKVPANYVVKNESASFTVSNIKYYLNDDFGDGNANGWALGNLSTGNAGALTPVLVNESTDNYMISFTSANGGQARERYLTKALSNPVEFSQDKGVVIETRVKGTSPAADNQRFFIKYNLNGTAACQNEWQHDWGTLLRSSGDSVAVNKGWNQNATTKLYGYSSLEGIVTETNDKWFTYKIILRGGATKDDAKADYVVYDANGKEIARKENVSLDFPDNSNWDNVEVAGATNANWDEGILKSVDFRVTGVNANVSVDYVKVYETELATVSLANGRYVKVGEPFVLKLTKQNANAVIPETEVIVKDAEGNIVASTSEYDKENGIITVTPENDLDGVYTVSPVDNRYVTFKGTTKLVIETRGDYETVVESEFDSGKDGWDAGVSNITTTVDTKAVDGKNVLYFKATEGVQGKDGYQPVAYKKLGNGFEVKNGKEIILKTRIRMDANAGRMDLKFNRPNSATQVSSLNDYTWNYYNLLRYAGGSPAVLSALDGYSGAGFKDSEGTYIGSVLGKWVDYTLLLDGVNKTITATAEVDGKIYTANGIFNLPVAAFEAEYGIGGAPSNVQALNSLTFKNTVANEEVYIDYVRVYDDLKMASIDIDGEIVELGETTEVYVTGYEGDFSEYVKLYNGTTEVTSIKNYNSETGIVTIKPETAPTAETTYTLKVELEGGYEYVGGNTFTVTHKPASGDVSESFDGNLDNWTKTNNRISGNIVTEGTNNFLRVSASDILKREAGVTAFGYSTPVDFMMDADGYTVFEAKIRSNSAKYRKILRLNADLTADEDAKSTNALWHIGDGERVSAAYYSYSNAHDWTALDTISTFTKNEWYTVRTIYDNANRTISFILLDKNGNLLGKKNDLSMDGMFGNDNDCPAASWFNYKDSARNDREKMRYIDNIALSLRSDVSEALTEVETFDIDDIKLYNIEDASGLTGYFEVSLTDANGNDVSGADAIPAAGGTYKAKVNHTLGTSKSFSVITALYNEGKLETVKTKTYTDVTSVTEDINEITLTSGTDRSIKVFVWDSVNNAVPLMAPITASGAETIKLYVSTKGLDTNDGSKDAPFASLTAAQAKAKTYNEDVTVLIEDGEYFIDEAITLNHNGKENAKITYKAIGNNAEFISGITLNVNDAIPANDTAKAKLVDDNAKAYLYEISLADYNIPAAALPGEFSRVYHNQVEAEGLTKGSWVTEPASTCEVFLEDEALTIARYPNVNDNTSGYKGYLTFGVSDVVNKGAVPRNWADDVIGQSYYVPLANRNPADTFEIKFNGDRADKWATAVAGPEIDRPILNGFWYYDWAMQAVPIASIDTTNNVFKSKYPSTYGLNTDANTDNGVRRYYVFNLLEEIDTRGEYFIDRTNKVLYFYKTDDMSGKRLMISLSGMPFDVTGSYTTLDGLKIKTTMGYGARVAGSHITVQNCDISNTASWAIYLSGDNCHIKNNYIHNVDGGISVSGGDAATFTAANHIIENNEFENFSRISKISRYAVELGGVGNSVIHNEFHNSEYGAISLGGVNNKIYYNNIYDVCKETDDAGAIYSGRSWVSRGNEIKYNYIHHIASTVTSNSGASPIAGVFLDDHLAGAHVEGNIFANIDGDGIRGNGGREHTITNNIFVNVDRGTVITAPKEDESFSTHKTGVEKYIGNAKWEEKYPQLFTKNGETTVVNTDKLKTVEDISYTKNFASGCKTAAYDFSGIPGGYSESNNNAVSTDAFSGDFTNNASKTGITGFEEIPFTSIRTTTVR